MSVAILIGLKHLDSAKTRLGPDLSGEQRRQLMRRMLEAVAAAALKADVGPVFLATSEPDGQAIAADLGVGLADDGGLPWNEGLVHALETLERPPRRVLYLAGDLPTVSADEIAALVAAAPHPGVAIARAHDGGTNALLVSPSTAIAPTFGVAGSAVEHRRRATAACLTAVTVDLPGLALDVDTADDAARAGVLESCVGA